MALTRPKYSQIYDTDWKQSVRVATVGSDVGNLTVGNTQPNTLDGVSLAYQDRILVKDQTRGLENGIYWVLSVGTGSNGWWARTADANADSFVTSGLTVDVTTGNVNLGKQFKLITQDPISLGNTALTFSTIGATAGGANTQVQFNDTSSLLGGSPAFTFNKTSNVLTVTGNVSATNFIGSGQYLTGITTYSNANVASYLPVYSGNVSATNFIGSGQYLTGITTYSNANVASYLPTYSGNISTSNLAASFGVFTNNLYFANGAPYSFGSPNSISNNASNVIVTDNYVNVAIASSNVAAFSSAGLTTTGNLNVGGNISSPATISGAYITASTATFGNISAVTFGNASAIYNGATFNATGNVSAAVYTGGAINVSGNILSTGAVHNSLTVNGTVNTNVASAASTILAGAVGVTGNIIANASVIYGNTSGGYGVRQFFNPITNSLDTVFG